MIYKQQFWRARLYDVVFVSFVVASLYFSWLKSAADILVTGTVIFDLVLTVATVITIWFLNSSKARNSADPDIQAAVALHDEYRDVWFLRSFIQTFGVFPLGAYLIGNWSIMWLQLAGGIVYWVVTIFKYGFRKRIMI